MNVKYFSRSSLFPIQASIQCIWDLKRLLILCEIKNGSQNTEKLLALFAVHLCTYGSRNHMYIVNFEHWRGDGRDALIQLKKHTHALQCNVKKPKGLEKTEIFLLLIGVQKNKLFRYKTQNKWQLIQNEASPTVLFTHAKPHVKIMCCLNLYVHIKCCWWL